MQISIVPSLPAQSKEELLQLAAVLRGVAQGFQVDLVDGVFVSAQSWPFNTDLDVLEELAAISQMSGDYEVEMDCMVMNPVQYFETFANVGAKRVIIHIGSTEGIEQDIAAAREYGLSVGVSLTNDVSLDVLHPLIPLIDFVQLMGIAVVGAQGQPFDERTLPRAAELRAAYPTLEIAVDGSVNAATIPRLKAAGVTRFAPGSAVAKTADPATAFQALEQLARS